MDQIQPVGPTFILTVVLSSLIFFIQYVKQVHWDSVQLTPVFPFDVPSIFGFNIRKKTYRVLHKTTQKHTTACHIKERHKIIKISECRPEHLLTEFLIWVFKVLTVLKLLTT